MFRRKKLPCIKNNRSVGIVDSIQFPSACYIGGTSAEKIGTIIEFYAKPIFSIVFPQMGIELSFRKRKYSDDIQVVIV